VTLSDGDLLTLMNLKLNLESNKLSIETDRPERTPGDPNMVSPGHGERNGLLYRSYLSHDKGLFLAVEAETNCKYQVKCVHLPWESASENELQDLRPDVV
jgi:hypothetical protein